MGATLTTVNGILKEVYEGQINDQLPNERVFLKRIERTAENVTDTIGGKYVVFPVRSGRNHGISYRAENAALAAAGNQTFKATQESLKYGYGRVRLTGQLMKLAEKNPQAFSSAMDEEMEGLKKDLSIDENRIAWGHADQTAEAKTGILAQLTSSPGPSTTWTVDTVQLLEVGMVIDIVTSASAVEVTGVTITAINEDTLTITTSSVTATTGSFVVRTGNWNNEPYGVCNIVAATGALHNLNPATAGQEFWKSTIDSTTTTLTELKMIQMCDNIYRKSGSHPTAVFCSLGVRRSYFNLLTGLRRYNEPKEFAGGLVGLSFMYGAKDIPVVADLHAPPSNMAFVTESEIKIYRDQDWYWEDTDGSVLKWVHDYDAFEGLMKQYWQIGTNKRSAHGRMTAITES